MMLPHLIPEQRRALVLLIAAGMDGTTETTMLANGFTLAKLGVLVGKGLVVVRWKSVRAGAKIIEVGCFRITDLGRRALKS